MARVVKIQPGETWAGRYTNVVVEDEGRFYSTRLSIFLADTPENRDIELAEYEDRKRRFKQWLF